MTKNLTLQIQKRTEKNLNKIKKEGFIPGILYGAKIKNVNVMVKKIDLEKAYSEVGESSLFDIELDGKKGKVIIKDMQTNPVKDGIVHVDFCQVDMDKQIEVELPLHFIGESKAVKNLGGILSINIDKIKVSCLPDELLEYFNVDISSLETFADGIRVSDLKLPKTFEVMIGQHDLIVNVLEPKKTKEFETKTAEEKPAAAKEASKK